MRWIYFLVLQIAVVLVVAIVIGKHDGKIALIKTPPQELAQWYKPENKRQVWLHNMFKLRREMQAVALYAKKQDDIRLGEWAISLNEHYRKIGDMVPSWRKKLDLTTLENINNGVKNRDYQNVLSDVSVLQKNCDGCHVDYQAITALTYRAPDFTGIKVTPTLSFTSHMNTLTEQVNAIKIASQDGLPKIALNSLANLNIEMENLGRVCVDCHKKDRKLYPNDQMNVTLKNLEKSLKSGTIKEQSMNLGTLAVQACAQCHGTHRLAFGAKVLLSKEQKLTELIEH